MTGEMTRERRLFRGAGIAATVVLALGLLAPIAITASEAFSGSGRPAFSHGATRIWGRALLRSGQMVATVVPLALLIGAPAAWAFRRRPFPGSRLLESAALVPLAVPGVALAFSLIQGLEGVPRFWLLAAGHLAYTIPLVVKTVGNAVETFDPRIETVARSLGASPAETAARVTLPLLLPALILSALLVFAVSWGEFNVSFLLAPQTFPAALYQTYTIHSFPVAAAATLVFLAPVVPALIAIQALGGEEFHRGLPA